jgi:acetolactate synthase-1/2/3 large subunit
MSLVSPASPAAAGQVRVLVVDDDGLQLRALQRSIRVHKHVQLSVSDNAIDALLHVGARRPDIVVMDIFMPGLNGIEACRRIKANPETRDVEVILASAAMTPELELRAREAGAARAVAKPLDLAALIEERARGAEASLPLEVSAPPVRGADLLVRMLEEAGVECVFGIPGGAISPVHDALIDSNIRVITTRSEAGAMFAAAGYAHATGKLAVVAVTSGPGALNAMTGLASAWCDGLPVLLLIGEVPRPAHGKGVLQDGSSHGLQIVEMMSHITKLALEVPRASNLPHMARRAIATAMSGRKGPVVLTLPLDVSMATLTPPRVGGAIRVGDVLAPATLDEIADLLLRAERPVLLAGSGCRGNGAPARLQIIAERFGCPVATTPKAKGVFPEDHALALGVFGLGGHGSAQRYMESGVDLVIALGTSLGDMSTNGFSPALQAQALVHVDIDAQQIGKSYSPTHAVVSSAVEFLGGLAARLLERGSPAPSRLRALPGQVERQKLPSSKKRDRIAPHDALAEIQLLLPRDTMYTVDSGEHFMFATHFLEINDPDSYIVMTGLGSMGQSIGAAIGAKLAHPHRSVAAICGDGCFAMNAFEIATAVAERLPIRVFVFNDERLGMVENGHEKFYGRRPEYPTTPLDVCKVAEGLGAVTFRIDGVDQLASAREILSSTPGPVVIDVRIDHEILLQKQDRVATMAPAMPPKPRPSFELVN